MSTAAVLVAVVAGLRSAKQERARLGEREAAIAQARELIEGIGDTRRSYGDLESELRVFQSQRVAEYFPPDTDRKMRRVEDKILQVRAKQEEDHYAVLDLLHRAVRLGADPDRVRRVRGELFMQEFLDELNYGDPARADMLRERIMMNDPTGDLTRQLARRTSAVLTTTPPGADAFLFREVDQSLLAPDGEHRLVPVPVGDPELPVLPGTWCLHVERGAGKVRAGDVITSVAGYPIRDTVLVSKGTDRIPQFARLFSAGGMAIRDDYEIKRIGVPTDPSRAPESIPFEFEHENRLITLHAKSQAQLGVTVAQPDAVAEAGGVQAEVWSSGRLRKLFLTERYPRPQNVTAAVSLSGGADRYNPDWRKRPSGWPVCARS